MPYENLSGGICEDCVEKVDSAFSFRTVVVNNEKDLLQRLPHLSSTCDDSESQVKAEDSDEDEGYDWDPELLEVFDFRGDDPMLLNKREGASVITKQMFKNCIVRCKKCHHTCREYEEWLRHRATHTDPVSYSMCSVCGKVVRTGNLNKHLVVHDSKAATCKICGKVFKHIESLRGHAPVHQDRKYECDLCDKTFKFQHNLAKHRRTHFGR